MGNSFLLIVVGLLLFYLVISNKWFCVEGFVGCITGANNPTTGGAPLTSSPIGAPTASPRNPYPSNVNWGAYGTGV